MATAVLKFLKTEAGGGALLAIAACAAILIANSPLSAAYFDLLRTPLKLDLGFWAMEATLRDWVKDGLMAVFFYMIGLELKREVTVGELSNPRTIMLPVAAAIGGALVPILLYSLLAGDVDPRGWPVPVATDIAFALAALAILSPRIDPRLRLFLLTLAVVDDLIAILLIAVLFTSNIAWVPLLGALALLVAVWAMGRRMTLPIWLYPIAALVTWALARESGVHTSVMAVAAAMVTPARPVGPDETLVGQLQHYIHPLSAFLVLPVFAFCAAGVSFEGLSLEQMAGGVTAGVAIALALGKPVGVASSALVTARLLRAPSIFSPMQIIGIGCLCGIGFTMSLFIGSLAFAGDEEGEAAARLGVLLGSALSLMMAAVAFRLRPVRSSKRGNGASWKRDYR